MAAFGGQKMQNLDDLELCLEGETRPFADWTRDFVDTYYPDVGRRCYRVPALYFNAQTSLLSAGTNFEGSVLSKPDDSDVEGDLAHTLVLESLERLGEQLQDRLHSPLFLISSLHYDNYLAKLQAPSRGVGKKSSPQTSAHNSGKKGSRTPPKGGRRSQTPPKGSQKARTEIPSLGGRGSGSDVPSESGDNKCGSESAHRTDETKDSELQRQSGGKTGSSNASKGRKQRPEPFCHESKTSGYQLPLRGTNTGGSALQGSEPSTQLKNQAEEGKKRTLPLSGQSRTSDQRGDAGGTPTSTCILTQSIRGGGGGGGGRGGGDPQEWQLPPRPSTRGEIDVLILSQKWGVVLMEVKATGMSAHLKTHSRAELCAAIRKSVKRAATQVERGRAMFQSIMPDLDQPPGVTTYPVSLVIALPAVPRGVLDEALADVVVDPDVSFLCKEDLPSKVDDPSTVSAIYQWWTSTFPGSATSAMSLPDLRKVVGRVCGLLSVVSVWTRNKPRVEVRTRAQAISEAADRFSDIVLLPQQAALLAQPSFPRRCIFGNMGSGKTLLLQLKGRQWLQEGRRVVLISVRSTARGRAIGHVLEEAIRRGGAPLSAGSVERWDVALLEFDGADFKTQLERQGSTSHACFLLDELSVRHASFIVEELRKTFPSHPIWYTALAVTDVPHGFQAFRLAACLRSPPSVQLLLKELDLNPFHKDAYTTRSAARGLSCDGPPIRFLHHHTHKGPGRPQVCAQCACDVIEFMRDTLGLTIPAETADAQTNSKSSGTEKSHKRQKGKFVHASPLSFRDILILVSVPIPYYQRQPSGRWKTRITDVLRFLKYMDSGCFLSTLKEQGVPLNLIVDSTSAEIGMPSRDEVIVTDILAVPSLERKVVIFLPGGPKLTDSEVDGSTIDFLFRQLEKSDEASSENRTNTNDMPNESSSGSMADSLLDFPRSDSAMCSGIVSQASSPLPMMDKDTAMEMLSRILNQRPDAAAAAAAAAAAQVDFRSPSKKEMEQILLAVFGNTMILDTKAFQEGTSQEQSQTTDSVAEFEKQVEGSSQKLRMGSEMRGDSATIAQCFRDHQEGQGVGIPASSSEVAKFLVRDVGEEEGRREEDLLTIRQEISRLEMDDQDSLFMAASRCLSQLVVIMS